MRGRRLKLRYLVLAAVVGLAGAAVVGGTGEERAGEEPGSPSGGGRGAEPEGSATRPPPVLGRNPVERTAALFASDWLDYLAGARPVSAVRGARPELLIDFAGGEAPDTGPGREGLRSVLCARSGEARHLCVARVAELGRLRFMAAGHGRRARVVELDLE